MIEVLVETRTVWRSKAKRRGRFTRLAAYRDAAWAAWWERHPCECEAGDAITGYPGNVCAQHWREEQELDLEMVQARLRTINRLARWLRWRDKRRAELDLAHCETHGDCNEPKGIRAGVGFVCAVERALLQPERDLRKLRGVLVELVAKIDARIGAET